MKDLCGCGVRQGGCAAQCAEGLGPYTPAHRVWPARRVHKQTSSSGAALSFRQRRFWRSLVAVIGELDLTFWHERNTPVLAGLLPGTPRSILFGEDKRPFKPRLVVLGKDSRQQNVGISSTPRRCAVGPQGERVRRAKKVIKRCFEFALRFRELTLNDEELGCQVVTEWQGGIESNQEPQPKPFQNRIASNCSGTEPCRTEPVHNS